MVQLKQKQQAFVLEAIKHDSYNFWRVDIATLNKFKMNKLIPVKLWFFVRRSAWQTMSADTCIIMKQYLYCTSTLLGRMLDTYRWWRNVGEKED